MAENGPLCHLCLLSSLYHKEEIKAKKCLLSHHIRKSLVQLITHQELHQDPAIEGGEDGDEGQGQGEGRREKGEAVDAGGEEAAGDYEDGDDLDDIVPPPSTNQHTNSQREEHGGEKDGKSLIKKISNIENIGQCTNTYMLW